jgi:hypothetical protein
MTPLIPASPVYRTAKGWRLLLYGLLTPLLVLFIALPFLLWQGAHPGLASLAFMGLICLGMAGVLLYTLVGTARGRFIIGPERLTQVGAFTTQALPLAAVQGYRIAPQHTFIVPHAPGRPPLKISYTTERYAEIKTWLASYFPNLDELERAAAEAAALADTGLGSSPGARSTALARARRTAKALNLAGALVAAWLFLYPHPYQLAVAAGLLLPLLGAGLLWRHAGALQLEEQPNRAYPSVMLALALPSLGLILRVLFDVELVSTAAMWPVAGLVSLGLAGLLARATRGVAGPPPGGRRPRLSLLMVATMYG